MKALATIAALISVIVWPIIFYDYETHSQAQKEKNILELQTPHYPPSRNSIPFSPVEAWSAKIKRMRLIKADDQGIVFDHEVNQSPQGFRIDTKLKSSKKKRHLFLIGCSLTFGNGVSDQETFAARIAQRFSETEVVNMGKRGSWVGEHWYLWNNYDFSKLYLKEEGHMIVTILDDHFFRMKRTWANLSWLSPLDLDLEMTETGPKVRGLLKNGFSLNFAYLLRKIPLLEYLWLRLVSHMIPIELRGAETEMAEYLLYLKKDYLQQYPKGRFVVSKMLSYSWVKPPLNQNEFFKQLNKRGIEIWDNSDMDRIVKSKYTLEELRIPRDSHPSPLTHELQADFFIGKINL